MPISVVRRPLSTLLAGAAAAAVMWSYPAGSGAEETREVVRFVDPQRARNGPLFVPASSLLDERGEPRWDELQPGIAAYLRRTAEVVVEAGSEEVCSVVFACGAPVPTSFEEVVQHAAAAYRGTVLEVVNGFGGSSPTTLLTLSLDRILFAHDGMPADETVRLVYPHAKFDFGGIPICYRSSELPRPAEPGDELLVLPQDRPLDAEGRVLWAHASAYVFADADGRPEPWRHLSDGTRVVEAGSLDGVETLVWAIATGRSTVVEAERP